MNEEEKKNHKFVLLVHYFSALLNILFVCFNLYMFRISGSVIWCIFAGLWFIDGISGLWKGPSREIEDRLNDR